MTKICVKRFTACHSEKDRSQGNKADNLMLDHEEKPVKRIERRKDTNVIADVHDAARCKHQKP